MSTELVNYEQRWLAEAQQAVSDEPLQDGNFISTRGGQLMFGDNALPGNQVACIVIDSVRENTYYADTYNSENPQPPICYAAARGTADMFPHLESMRADQSYFAPQHVENGQILGCTGCPRNEWGSSPRGRGKACQNRRRLALLPAGVYMPRHGSRDFDLEIYNTPAHFMSAEVAYIKLPVTSVKGWGTYVNQVARLPRPPHGVVTRLYVEPDPNSQYVVRFEVVEQVPDELAQIVMQRHAEEAAKPWRGYAPPRDVKPPF